MVTKTPTSQYREVWRTAFHSQLNTTNNQPVATATMSRWPGAFARKQLVGQQRSAAGGCSLVAAAAGWSFTGEQAGLPVH